MTGSRVAPVFAPSPDLEQGARAEGRLVCYSRWPTRETEKVTAAFTRRFPFLHVEAPVYEHPAGRIRQDIQQGRPTCDIVGPTTATLIAGLADDGLLASYNSPEGRRLAPVFQGPQGLWHSTHSMGMCTAYNTRLVAPSEAPRAMEDLLDPRWKGKLLMEDPRRWGTSLEWVYGVYSKLGEGFFHALAKQDPVWYEEGAIAYALDRVAAGDYPLTPWAVDYIVQLRIEAGQPLAWVNPLNLGRVPAHAIPAEARHPCAARLFLDWLLSAEGQDFIGRENLGFPALPGVPCYMARFYPQGVSFAIHHPSVVARAKGEMLAMFQRVFFSGSSHQAPLSR